MLNGGETQTVRRSQPGGEQVGGDQAQRGEDSWRDPAKSGVQNMVGDLPRRVGDLEAGNSIFHICVEVVEAGWCILDP